MPSETGTNFDLGYYIATRPSVERFNLSSSGPNANSGTITYRVTPNYFDGDGVSAYHARIISEVFVYLENITGINFEQTTDYLVSDIYFTDNASGAYTFRKDASGDGYTDYAIVNVSPSWENGSGGLYNGYVYQTFIHEILHSIGLNHPGPYNGTANYEDAYFFNDSWLSSIMSYFNQGENPTISPNANFAYLQTAMVADIVALDLLYAFQVLVGENFGSYYCRIEDTVYGFNTSISDSDDPILSYLSKFAPTNAYCIVDGGGTDTFDFSGWSFDQFIDLTVTELNNAYPTLSKIAGLVGNLTLAVGTIIENVISGSGNDVLLGNIAANVLDGGAGNDTLVGGAGIDTFTVGSGTDTVRDLGTGGADVLSVAAGAIANATVNTAWTATSASVNSGTANITTSGLAVSLAAVTSGNGFSVTNTGTAATLTGSSGADILTGGTGADTLVGGASNDTLYGDEGDDAFIGGSGNEYIDGGSGVNFAWYSGTKSAYLIVKNSNGSITVTDQRSGSPDGTDTIINIYSIIFSDQTILTSSISLADTVAPTLSSMTPGDEATSVLIGANAVLNFSETVIAGSGNILIKSGNTTVQTISVTDTSQVTFSGSTVTINPSSDGVPPVKWSTFWDNFIPRYGGSKDDSQTGKGRRHSYEASAG